MSQHRHRGHRAVRRADRRRRRMWVGVAAGLGVLVVLVGGFAAAAVLAGDGDAEVATTPVATRAPSTTVSVAATTVATVPGLPCRAALTVDAPLRLWIAGDSIAHSVGNGLGKKAANTGVVAPVYESRVSSGLGSPGFFDWPRRVAEELPRVNPEVVVFVMGTNDWGVPQASPTDASGQPAWRAGYTKQVQGMVDALTADGRTLYWVGPPVLRDTKQEAGVKELVEVIRGVVDAHPQAEFFDLHDLLDGTDGTYTATVDADGKRLQVRTGDGVHLTADGADFVGDALFAELDAQCRLKAQAVADAKQQLVETRGSTSVAPGSTATAPPQSTTPPTVAATAPPTTAGSTPSTTTVPTTTQPTTPTGGTTPPTT
ncbi:MAG: DUF459 domain-containing protein [Actinobacteria bacterium]|nr:DUF459 domain-containing protein [Actinomycetota bacterium]